MNGNLLDGLNPVTQTIESGKALASFLGMNEELPVVIGLANGARLVLSTKRDCYHFTSEKGRTCKAGTYGRLCKHRKAMEDLKGLFAKPGVSYNLPGEERAVSSPAEKMLIDAYTPITTEGEVAYWQAKPQEA